LKIWPKSFSSEKVMHLADPLKTAVPEPASSRVPRRFLAFVLLVIGLVAAFGVPLYSLARHAMASDLHSHILLIPFVSVYLIYIHWKQLPQRYVSSPRWAMLAAAIAFIAAGVAWGLRVSGYPISTNDYLALMAFAFVCFVAADGFLLLGRDWMRAAAFPMAFLIFIVPLPDPAADFLENASKLASAEVANVLFIATGTPVLRDGTVFQLPGIAVEVAKECSGIRSSWVLFITSLLASYLFLRSPWRRASLVAAVIPLGVLRNGFRILVISLLCVHYGPHMINSLIHRRGGPVFFTASLIPLFLLLWWLRRGETAARRRETGSGGEEKSVSPITG
jgi:exosortase C (VPDSG-CTERM-specific)